MEKRTWNVISILVLVILIIIAIFYLNRYREDFYLVKNISILQLVILSLLVNLSGLVSGVRIKIFANFFKIHLTFVEWFGLKEVTSMGNYLTPFRGGAGVRAFYLKKKYKFPYKLFLSTMGGNFIVAIFTYSLIGMLLLLWIYIRYSAFNYILFVIIVVALLSSLAIILFSNKIPRIEIKMFKKIIDFMYKVKGGWEYIRKDPKKIFKIILVEFFYIFFDALSLYYTFIILLTKVPFTYVMLMTVIGSLSILIAITPGGLGIKEGALVWVSTLMGVSLEVALYAAIIVRLVMLIWAFTLGPIFSYILIRPMKQ